MHDGIAGDVFPIIHPLYPVFSLLNSDIRNRADNSSQETYSGMPTAFGALLLVCTVCCTPSGSPGEDQNSSFPTTRAWWTILLLTIDCR